MLTVFIYIFYLLLQLNICYLKYYFHFLGKRLSSCKAVFVTVAKRGIWGNSAEKNDVLLRN